MRSYKAKLSNLEIRVSRAIYGLNGYKVYVTATYECVHTSDGQETTREIQTKVNKYYNTYQEALTEVETFTKRISEKMTLSTTSEEEKDE